MLGLRRGPTTESPPCSFTKGPKAHERKSHFDRVLASGTVCAADAEKQRKTEFAGTPSCLFS